MLTVGVIGGLGEMAWPMSQHWRESKAIRVAAYVDRNTPGAIRDERRACWRDYGAKPVPSVEALFDLQGEQPLDGVFICCGKNGDDLALVAKAAAGFCANRSNELPFICHLSTVSAAFSQSASRWCENAGVRYVNYPLTGGPKGAQAASMLILASGDQGLYHRLLPALAQLGKPQFFGEHRSAAAEVKLIGHLLVFGGLVGIGSGAALASICFAEGNLTDPRLVEFFDFLNDGAGGTRQWDVALRAGVAEDCWDRGFNIRYAAIDLLYALQLCAEKKLSLLTLITPAICCLTYAQLIARGHEELATHALVKEFGPTRTAEIESFVLSCLKRADTAADLVAACEAALPESLRQSALLEVSEQDFS